MEKADHLSGPTMLHMNACHLHVERRMLSHKLYRSCGRSSPVAQGNLVQSRVSLAGGIPPEREGGVKHESPLVT